MQLSANGIFTYVDYIVAITKSQYKKEILAYSYFERSEVSVRGFAANLDQTDALFYPEEKGEIIIFPKMSSQNYFTKILNGKENIWHGVCISEAINNQYIVTNKQNKDRDIYNWLMGNFTYPILQEWLSFIVEVAKKENILTEVQVEIYGRVPKDMEDLVVYEVSIKEAELKQIISSGLRNKQIRITEEEQLPLEFKNMDDYFLKYGQSLIDNLEGKLNPLVSLKEKVDTVAFLKKRFYPQQAAIVNGVIELMKEESYAIINEDMGCGKTLQAMGVVEGFFHQRKMKETGCSLKEVCENKDAISYRNVIMCPSHLVNKWAESIKDDIPYAKVIIVRGLKELIKLQKKGKKRTQKEFYIFSKDNAKLSYSYMPLPTQIKVLQAARMQCVHCKNPRSIKNFKICKCGSKIFEKEEFDYLDSGLVCPECGMLLYSADIDILTPDPERHPLQPSDFGTQTKANRMCRHCGSLLWQPACEPKNHSFFYQKPKERKLKWLKLTHFANKAKKNKKTTWVYYRDKENFISRNGLQEDEISYPNIYCTRRFSPSRYVKKYLKGFFDFAIFDEAQEYKGGGSAQGLSMHDLASVSKWKLALTGTISGGYATHLFYLLYRLDPARMKKMGYEYSSIGERKFAERYGTIVTEYEIKKENGQYNSMSRGKMISSPKCVPGISLDIFPKFLLDRGVFLNLSDMSAYLPPLKEIVEYVPLEDEIFLAYKGVRESIKKAMKLPGLGKSLLGTYLQFSLSYTDKPYNRSPILSPKNGQIIANIPDLSHLVADEKLLNKEKRLCEIVKKEQEKNRNIFIYCEYTGNGEANISYRLKDILEKNCGLKGNVEVLESSNPPAEEREEWMHQKAAEGIKVFITNPRCVKTGLDFLFYYEDIRYNYPTIIYYQFSYDLIVMWQASRRSYRLNQIEESGVFYLVSDRTIQIDALELVASKQVATSAIQGQFSSEGLSAMAQGVDPKIQLAQAATEKTPEQKRGLKAMFDVLNKSHEGGQRKIDILMPTFTELTGLSIPKDDLFNRELLDIVHLDNLIGMLVGPVHIREKEEQITEIETRTELETITEPETITESKTLEPIPDNLFSSFLGSILPTNSNRKNKSRPKTEPNLFQSFFSAKK